MSVRGTAFDPEKYSGQFAQLMAIIAMALSKILKGFDFPSLLRTLQIDGERFTELLTEVFKKMMALITYPFTIDYQLTVEQMVNMGNYTYHDPEVNSQKFPHDPNRGIEHVNVQCISSDQLNIDLTTKITRAMAIEKMKSMGYRSASPAETFAFGARYPKEHMRLKSILCLDSSCRDKNDNPCVLHLYLWGGEAEKRALCLLQESCAFGLGNYYLVVYTGTSIR